MKVFFAAILSFVSLNLLAQPGYWQQQVKYTMDIDMDVTTNQYTGKQKLEYTNNSPDTLKHVFFHLYWNAFQPNSMMDERSRRQGTMVLRKDRNGNDLLDWDPRVKDRILNLKPEEIGFETIRAVEMDGRGQNIKFHETIMEVDLDKPILPKSKATFEMDWSAQVPLQVRRSGRDNPNTLVRYTMTQWYPKMAEYDKEGWHPTPYVGREFYGVWGDYDVTIHIDKKYLLGGSGTIVNAPQVGYGYAPNTTGAAKITGDKLTWHFVAPNVHDFAWAADPEYKHLVRQVPNGPTIHVLYNAEPPRSMFQNLPSDVRSRYNNDFNRFVKEYWDGQWTTVADAAVTVYPFIKRSFGEYPYKQYSFIHGGDGGMEYPNCTMISGPSLGTVFHEWLHTWYQGMMGTNESKYPWMDEGFTDWATGLVEEYYRQQVERKTLANNPAELRRSDSMATIPPAYHYGSYAGYLNLARSNYEEPMTTHADHYNTNYAYSTASYAKGAVFMEQLGYIVSAPVRDKILLEYYRQWRFKHPDVNDFMMVAQKVSGLQLDWYQEYFVNTTKTIDYSIDSLYELNGVTTIRLRNTGEMPMPLDVKVNFKDGTSEWHYIPMSLMFGEKAPEPGQEGRKVYAPWRWTSPTYEISTAKPLMNIVSVEIDPSGRMADIDRKRNKLELNWGK